ncbi:hypothetical protein HRbin36_00547 [bacterium HR36]|nr:hypothetical protein HRbin36_00547 [bacterium HR36]
MAIQESFFPTVWFGWVWLAPLLGMVFAAAYVDLRRYVIPKALAITILVTGVLANIFRGAWLGVRNQSVWLLPAGPFLGAVDGFLFALAGFVVGFGLFFALWLLRTCGGGDVKLFAAISAWLGPLLCLWVLGLSIVLVALLGTVKMLYGLIRIGPNASLPSPTTSRRRSDKELTVQEMLERGQRPKRLLSFSLPVALALTVCLAWKFRHELGLPEIFGVEQPASSSQVTQR